MAYQNQIIYNPVTGQSIKFIQTSWDTSGQLLEMESTYSALSKEPPMHYHPDSAEDFRIISGRIKVRMDNKISVYKAGESFHISPNRIHSIWNDGESKAAVNWKVTRPMNTEFLLETMFALVNDGKVNEQGTPRFLQMVLTAGKFNNVLRLARPPFALQRIVFVLLKPFAYALGYRPYYKRYLSLKKGQQL